MKKKICALLVVGCLLGMLQGCSAYEKEKKISDVEYTVMCPEDVPQELADEIKNLKYKEFQLSYEDGEYLYVAKGYGKRNSSGFNISVKEMYVTEHTLVFDTEITGPKEGQDVSEKATTPYVVVKMEAMDKQVVFK